jgi:hypothetical protein
MIRRMRPSRYLALCAVLFISLALGLPQSEAGKGKKAQRRAEKQAARSARKDDRKAERKQASDAAPKAGGKKTGAALEKAKPEPRQKPRTNSKTEHESPEILALGEGDERFWVAFEDKYMSIWADHMPADKLLEHLESYGGPTQTSFEPLTRPVTLSLVRVRMEQVLRKMLGGYDTAYIYDEGRLAHVRILNYVPGTMYKVVDPIVSRLDWTEDVLRQPHP